MAASPRVSVVVPNYNHARYLQRRIDSILEQTYQDFELILLDDASTDESLRVFEQYRGDSRATLIVNSVNSGSPFAQWNRGVQLARGEYVWIAEADDDAERELLQTLVAELDNCPSAALAYCQSCIIDERGTRLGPATSWTDDLDPARWLTPFRSCGGEEARRYLVFKNTIFNASAVVFRRSAFLESGGAPADMRISGDRMTWVSLALRGDVVFNPRPLNLFRQHAGTVRASTSAVRRLREGFTVITAIERAVGIPHDIRRNLARRLRHEWQAEYARDSCGTAWSLVWRVAAFLWRMHPAAAAKFVLFFVLREAPQGTALRPAHRLWTSFNRLGRKIGRWGF